MKVNRSIGASLAPYDKNQYKYARLSASRHDGRRTLFSLTVIFSLALSGSRTDMRITGQSGLKCGSKSVGNSKDLAVTSGESRRMVGTTSGHDDLASREICL
jgi:hypothetical protein